MFQADSMLYLTVYPFYSVLCYNRSSLKICNVGHYSLIIIINACHNLYTICICIVLSSSISSLKIQSIVVCFMLKTTLYCVVVDLAYNTLYNQP